MQKYLTLLYLCDCLREEASFQVAARARDQDVSDWMKNEVTPALSADHRRRSPLCLRPSVKYLKIPAPEGRPVGTPPEAAN